MDRLTGEQRRGTGPAACRRPRPTRCASSAGIITRCRRRRPTSTRQRQGALDSLAAVADWVLQIDSDEVLPDIEALLAGLRHADSLGLRIVEWPMRVLYRSSTSAIPLWLLGKMAVGTSSTRAVAVRPAWCSTTRGGPRAFPAPDVDGDDASLQVARPAADGEDRSFRIHKDQTLRDTMGPLACRRTAQGAFLAATMKAGGAGDTSRPGCRRSTCGAGSADLHPFSDGSGPASPRSRSICEPLLFAAVAATHKPLTAPHPAGANAGCPTDPQTAPGSGRNVVAWLTSGTARPAASPNQCGEPRQRGGWCRLNQIRCGRSRRRSAAPCGASGCLRLDGMADLEFVATARLRPAARARSDQSLSSKSRQAVVEDTHVAPRPGVATMQQPLIRRHPGGSPTTCHPGSSSGCTCAESGIDHPALNRSCRSGVPGSGSAPGWGVRTALASAPKTGRSR